jgi:hypothetical protein
MVSAVLNMSRQVVSLCSDYKRSCTHYNCAVLKTKPYIKTHHFRTLTQNNEHKK